MVSCSLVSYSWKYLSTPLFNTFTQSIFKGLYISKILCHYSWFPKQLKVQVNSFVFGTCINIHETYCILPHACWYTATVYVAHLTPYDPSSIYVHCPTLHSPQLHHTLGGTQLLAEATSKHFHFANGAEAPPFTFSGLPAPQLLAGENVTCSNFFLRRFISLSHGLAGSVTCWPSKVLINSV